MIVTIIKHPISVNTTLNTIDKIQKYLDKKGIDARVSSDRVGDINTLSKERINILKITIPEGKDSPQEVFDIGIAVQMLLTGYLPLK